MVHVGDALKAATSTDIDGRYTILFAPNATYHVSADLTAFGQAERDLTLGAPPCDTTVDFQLTLRPRGEAVAPAAAPPASANAAAGSGAPGQAVAQTPAQDVKAAAGQGTPAQAPVGRGAGGRGGARGQNAQGTGRPAI